MDIKTLKRDIETQAKRNREKARKIKDLKGKAIFVIESYVCNDDFANNKLLSLIYRYAHVANGMCENKHLDWKEELEKDFQNMLDAIDNGTVQSKINEKYKE